VNSLFPKLSFIDFICSCGSSFDLSEASEMLITIDNAIRVVKIYFIV